MPEPITPELRELVLAKIRYHRMKYAQLKTTSYHRGVVDALQWLLAKERATRPGESK